MEESEALLKENLELARKSLGPNNPKTIDSLYALFSVYLAQGKENEAFAILTDLEQKLHDVGKTNTAFAIRVASRIQDKLIQFGFPERARLRALGISALVDMFEPVNDPTLGSALMSLSRTIVDANNIELTEKLLEFSEQCFGDEISDRDRKTLDEVRAKLAQSFRKT